MILFYYPMVFIINLLIPTFAYLHIYQGFAFNFKLHCEDRAYFTSVLFTIKTLTLINKVTYPLI